MASRRSQWNNGAKRCVQRHRGVQTQSNLDGKKAQERLQERQVRAAARREIRRERWFQDLLESFERESFGRRW